MLVTGAGIVILVRPVQLQNADSPILVTELGISTLVTLEFCNAPLGIEVVPSANITFPVQLLNASFPMLVTELGISMLVTSAFCNAPLGIEVVPSANITFPV